MTIQLYKSNFFKTYSAGPVSSAALFCYCTYIFIFSIPFILVCATQNFWLTNQVGYEQISLKYTNEYLVYIYDNTNVNEMNKNIKMIYNQENFIKNKDQKIENYPEFPAQVEIQCSKLDYNNDGLMDQFDIEFKFKGTNVQKIVIFLFFDVQFNEFTKVNTKAMFQFKSENINGIQRAIFYGKPTFVQKQPIQRSRHQYKNLDNINPFEEYLFNIQDTIEGYNNRPYKLMPSYQKIVLQKEQSEQVLSDVSAQITLQTDNQNEIIYKPSFLALIRFSWIQYFPLFLTFLFFGQFLLKFIYSNHFFATNLTNNLPYNTRKVT